MAAPQPGVYWTWLPSTFSLLPSPQPAVLPPPANEHTLRAPFGINATLYNAALRPEIPVLVAATYIALVFYLNAYNRRNNHRAWTISRTAWFPYFVIVHNVVLAAYSFLTCVAMGRAIAHTFPSWDAGAEWKVRAADALCKLHGPRGLGDAATFNTTINIWEVKNTAIKLTGGGNPDPTDVGRLWNEGLAFWGWLFYVSKFYEVLDTGIILAKGKRSATLQTYHHAGAMLCMWAGIRYMSPPIWMFVFINSAIHAMMYTYFTLSALGIRIPQSLKRTLTILQIAQFVWGASYAAAHLFIQYDIPITVPFQLIHHVSRAASSASSAASSATSLVSSAIESPTSPAVLGLLKKLLLRAAGEEGVAERLRLESQASSFFGAGGAQQPLADVGESVQHFIEQRFETRYRTDWTRINCIDTTGEAFAIYLNLLYLSPLTWLFVRFFSRAYKQRRPSMESAGAKAKLRTASEIAKEAAEETKDEVERVGEQAEDKTEEAVEEVKKPWRDGRGSDAAEAIIKASPERARDVVRRMTMESTDGDSVETAGDVVQKAQQAVQDASQKLQEATSSFVSSPTETTAVKGDSSSASAPAPAAPAEESETKPTPASSEEKAVPEVKPEPQPEPEPEPQQDLSASQEDTDAMGKSGAIVKPEDAEEGVAGGEGGGAAEEETKKEGNGVGATWPTVF